MRKKSVTQAVVAALATGMKEGPAAFAEPEPTSRQRRRMEKAKAEKEARKLKARKP